MRREVVGAVAAWLMAWAFFIAVAPRVMSFGAEQGLNLLLSVYERSITTERVFVSPTNLGDATFTEKQDYMSTSVTLELHDHYGKPIDLGLVSDRQGLGQWPEKAFWSKDGTVFVVEDLELMYDLRNYTTQPPREFANKVGNAPSPTYDLKKFIASRGGEGPNVLAEK